MSLTSSCPVCGGRQHDAVFAKQRVPRYLLERHFTRSAAIDAATGDIDIRLCPDCGFAFNGAFDAALMDYVVDYESSRSHSEYFIRYLESVAEAIDRAFHAAGKTVVEVGCGDGELLKTLRRRAAFDGWGFEPSMARTGQQPVHDGLKFVADYYRRDLLPTRPELMILRHVLEHQADVGRFLRGLLGDEGGQPEQIYVEVPAWEWIVDHDHLFALTYEHCSYFCATSLAKLLRSLGFARRQVSFTFEDEYLQCLGFKGRPDRTVEDDDAGYRQSVVARTRAFTARIPAIVDRMRDHFAEPADTVLWGAAGKGTSLLNLLDVDHRRMPFVVDSNPRRQGTFIPVTGQEVVAPESLAQIQPKRVLLTNASYRAEIEARLVSLGVVAEISVVG